VKLEKPNRRRITPMERCNVDKLEDKRTLREFNNSARNVFEEK